jgi:hypothetical protein
MTPSISVFQTFENYNQTKLKTRLTLDSKALGTIELSLNQAVRLNLSRVVKASIPAGRL